MIQTKPILQQPGSGHKEVISTDRERNSRPRLLRCVLGGREIRKQTVWERRPPREVESIDSRRQLRQAQRACAAYLKSHSADNSSCNRSLQPKTSIEAQSTKGGCRAHTNRALDRTTVNLPP